MKSISAFVGTVLAGMSFLCGSAASAKSVSVTATAGLCNPVDDLVCYSFSVTNNLGGDYRIYEFAAGILGFGYEAPPGFELQTTEGALWIADDYGTALAPGQTGGFGFLTGGYAADSFLWSAVAEGDPSKSEPDLTFAGNALPEPSTSAMMLLGFAGLGFAGYRASRRTAAVA